MIHIPATITGELPISLAEVRERHGITQDDDTSRNPQLLSRISLALEYLEKELGIILVRRLITSRAKSFDSLELIRPDPDPALVIKYLDADGIEQTLDALLYNVNPISLTVTLKATTTAPELYAESEYPVWIEYLAGFTTLPIQIREAAHVMMMQWERNQTDIAAGFRPLGMPYAAHELLQSYREFRHFF